MKKDFYYPSHDGLTQIHGVEWVPEDKPKAILQMCHGMAEYIERYHEFAEYLSGQGFYVVGHDHLGHGDSVQNEEDYGFFHQTEGNRFVIADIHKLRGITEKKYPDVPYFMLGHSMGSFLLRQYLTIYSKGLRGAIVMGTGHQGAALLIFARLLCRIIAIFKGWKHRSPLVYNLSFGSYNKRFEPTEFSAAWISSDKEKCAEYEADARCGFRFTLGGYYQMFAGMKTLTGKAGIARIDKTLPIHFVSGTEDPVGAFGKGVEKVYEQYKQAGLKNVTMKLYEGDRHEILNETDRKQVYEDLWQWMNEKI